MIANFHVFNIRFSEKCSVISVTGPEALMSWAEPKYINAYGKHYAEVKKAANMPDEIDIQLDFNFASAGLLDNLVQVEDKIKRWLEEKSELDLISFDYTIVNCID